MDLEILQTKLLGLIKSTYQASENDEPYIRSVAQSEHLNMVKDIVLWWLAFEVERFCLFTSSLLKQRGLFAAALNAFARHRSISPFIEQLGQGFLEEMTKHQDDVVASLAQFELALIKVKKGDPNKYVIDWQVNPNTVLGSILEGISLNEHTAKGCYQTVVSRSVPDMFHVSGGDEIAKESELLRDLDSLSRPVESPVNTCGDSERT